MFLDTNRRYELRDIEPQMNAPSRACLRHALRTGGRTHALRSNAWILHCGGHDGDERRFVVPGLCLNWRGAGSLAAQGAGVRQWRHFSNKGRIWV